MDMKNFFKIWAGPLYASLLFAVGFGTFESFSIYVVAISSDLQVERTFVQTIFSSALIISALVSFLIKNHLDRIDISILGALASLLLSIGYYVISFSNSFSLLAYCFIFLVAPAFSMIVLCAQFSANRFITDARRGRANGLAYAGLGVGNFIIFNITGYLIVDSNWQTGFRFFSVVSILALCASIAFYFVPKQKLFLAEEDSVKPSLGNSIFLNIVFIACITGALDMLWFQNYVPFLESQEVNLTTAAFALSIMSLGYIAGHLTSGFVTDKFGPRFSILFVVLCGIIGFCLTLSNVYPALIYISPAMIGAFIGSIVCFKSTITGYYFNENKLGYATSLVQVSSIVGGAAGVLIGPIIFSLLGTYYIIAILSLITIFIWYLFANATLKFSRKGVFT